MHVSMDVSMIFHDHFGRFNKKTVYLYGWVDQAMAPNSVDQRSGALLWEAAIDLGKFLSRHQTKTGLDIDTPQNDGWKMKFPFKMEPFRGTC